MLSRRIFLQAGLALSTTATFAQNKRTIVTSFSILADFVKVLAGNTANVVSLVGLDQDAHHFNPLPKDITKLAKADLFVTNGLGFDGFALKLATSANYNKEVVIATKGIKSLTSSGSTDPHAWQDVENTLIYIDNIANGLIKIDKENAILYQANATQYKSQLTALHNKIKSDLAKIPRAKRKIVTSHDAFTYFGDAYDVDFYAPEGAITNGSSAQQIAKVIKQIKDEKISALFIENLSNNKILQQISKETGVKIGGTLYSDSLSKAAPSYLQMMAHNGNVIQNSLR